MRLGVKLILTITDAGALRNVGYVETERATTEDESIRLLFENAWSCKAFKISAVDVQGAGSERVVRIVADVRNKEDLVREANDFIAYEKLCQEPITSPFSAFQDLVVSKNNYTCRAQIGVSFDDGVQMNNTDIRRVIERSSESQLGR